MKKAHKRSVFLCHSSADKPFVHALARHLEKRRIRYWLDEAEIRVGDSLIDRIGSAIHEMDLFCVVVSGNSIESPWVKRELNAAMVREFAEDRVVVLPVLLEPVALPDFLRDKLYADFTTPEKTLGGLEKLLDQIEMAAD